MSEPRATDPGQLERLREQIGRGAYRVDPAKVAEAMLRRPVALLLVPPRPQA